MQVDLPTVPRDLLMAGELARTCHSDEAGNEHYPGDCTRKGCEGCVRGAQGDEDDVVDNVHAVAVDAISRCVVESTLHHTHAGTLTSLVEERDAAHCQEEKKHSRRRRQGRRNSKCPWYSNNAQRIEST